MDAADAFVMNWADVSPAFVTSRAGYDVWLGNTRGNTYSRAHLKYDPDINKAKFWAYDFTDMGNYDVPANIDYILSYTGNKTLSYIGHSQGTT